MALPCRWTAQATKIASPPQETEMRPSTRRTAAFLVALACGFAIAPGTAEATDPIKIGLALDLTGPFAAAGTPVGTRQGFALAIDQLQSKLGGLPAEFIQVDMGGNPEQARQVVDRMINRDKIVMFSGPVGSNVALAVMPALAAAKVPYLTSNPGPSQLAGAQCNPYFLGVSYQNDTYHEAAGQYASDKGYKRTVVITQNYPAGKDAAEGFKRRFKGNIVDEIYVKLGQIDFGAEIAQIRADKADSLYFFLGPQFVKQFVASGLSKDVALIAAGFTADQENIDAVGEPMIGLYNTAAWAHDLPNPANQAFVKAYRARYKENPSVLASQAYDVIMAMDAAVRDVKGNMADRPALMKALLANDYESVRGKFVYGTNHYPIQNYYLRVIEKNAQGEITNRLVSTTPVLKDYQDSFVSECRMK
jgi:branched-chain amino acid transport system substrate-binding protein